MTAEQRFALDIVSLFLRNDVYHGLLPDTVRWDDVVSQGKKQGVTAMLYFGMDKAAVPKEKAESWRNRVLGDIGAGFRVAKGHVTICKLLEEEGIPTVILKGCASAHYYPHPEYRSLGDVDFYVEEEYRQRAREVLASNGYIEVMANRHHDWLYRKAGIAYELHFAFSGVPQGKEGEPFMRALAGIVQDRRWVQTKMGMIAIPSDFHHGLIILLHTASHLMSGGLGLRHLCDWAAFVNHFTDDEFQLMFREEFEALKVWRFAQVLTATCEKYLGIKKHSWTGDIDGSAVDKLMNEFLGSGDYSGDHDSRQSDLMASEGFSVRVGHRSSMGNLIAVLRNAVEYHWPRTRNNTILLILGMLYSAVRYLVRVLIGKREKLNLIEMSKEAGKRRELYREFGLVDGIEE